MDGWTVVITVVVSIFAGGGLGGIILALIARRKAKSEISVNDSTAEINKAEADRKEAETAEIITRTVGAVVQMLDTQICALRKEVDQLRADNDALRQVQAKHEREISHLQEMCNMFEEVLAGAHLLYEQVVEMKVQPKYKPPERRSK